MIRHQLSLLRRVARRLLRGQPAMAAMPAPTGGVGPGPVIAVSLQACTLFFSYLRLRGLAAVDEARWGAEATMRALFSARLLCDGVAPPAKLEILRFLDDGSLEFVLEAMIDRARPVEGTELELSYDGEPTRWALALLIPSAVAGDLRSMMPEFQRAVADRAAAGARPAMLDIGGRARSRVQRSELFPDCDVTVLDIVADPGVDVVGDAHELSRLFAPDSFDFAMSISVFEHLLMPWKVAVELNRVMRPGGFVLVHTHQTIGMHDMPWDFLRYSDAAWAGIFNRYTGFEVIKTDMSRFLHIVPADCSMRTSISRMPADSSAPPSWCARPAPRWWIGRCRSAMSSGLPIRRGRMPIPRDDMGGAGG